MATDIKCPSCGHKFAIEDAVSEDIKKELREKMQVFLKQKEDDFAKREKELIQQVQHKDAEYAKKLQEETVKLQQSLEVDLRKTIATDFETKLQLLQQTNKDQENKLVEARQKEIEFLQKEQVLKNKEAELELSVQRKLQEERVKLSEELRKLEEQKTATRENEYQLRLRELEKQLDDQKKLAEEMKRKAEQGSMQLQGEVQELILEEMLKSTFPFDLVSEVGKGIRGADCTLTIRNNLGQECGKIIFESKRTKHFDKNWIEKLKADMRSTSADIGVIVTQAMPEQISTFTQLDGIWICSFTDVLALVHVLRDGIMKIFMAAKTHENKGDKMHMLYGYLTSNEFSEQWKAIREGFQAMNQSIQREREAMEKLWKMRQKQLEKVLLNAAHIKGSIEGIAGNDNIQLDLIDDTDTLLVDE
ncbi:hypothetical protein A4H97_25755 [Niastella yeongjuensis]|uniref:Caldesmon n=1 Tax=Niastella yeongjuensis TaxID=354355 RepID=A0A1V9F168_9BACT|nr:DUF2130 domain-containing protein [Niastella yeongjuensis]OQP52024.1 hypothetical protein A4H97_25755 [Niastella yeongjuensis]SEP36626.1 hypothetical protein SAMN05660816_05495 [Niastella yeongjuensis]